MKVIANGFGERQVLKLMYAALIRATAQWRGITVTAFERKQWEVIREEIATAHGQTPPGGLTGDGIIARHPVMQSTDQPPDGSAQIPVLAGCRW